MPFALSHLSMWLKTFLLFLATGLHIKTTESKISKACYGPRNYNGTNNFLECDEGTEIYIMEIKYYLFCQISMGCPYKIPTPGEDWAYVWTETEANVRLELQRICSNKRECALFTGGWLETPGNKSRLPDDCRTPVNHVREILYTCNSSVHQSTAPITTDGRVSQKTSVPATTEKPTAGATEVTEDFPSSFNIGVTLGLVVSVTCIATAIVLRRISKRRRTHEVPTAAGANRVPNTPPCPETFQSRTNEAPQGQQNQGWREADLQILSVRIPDMDVPTTSARTLDNLYSTLRLATNLDYPYTSLTSATNLDNDYIPMTIAGDYYNIGSGVDHTYVELLENP